MMQSERRPLLSPEALQAQLSTIEVLTAMWAGDDELSIPASTSEGIEALARYLALPLASLGDAESVATKNSVPDSLQLALSIDPLAGSEAAQLRAGSARKAYKLMLEVTLLLRKLVSEQTENSTTRPRLRLRRSEWLNAAEHARLCSEACIEENDRISEGKDHDEEVDGGSYVLEAVERISEAAAAVLAEKQEQDKGGHASHAQGIGGPLSKRVYRSWSCLPSLSTKEKRQELVDYAALNKPPLTGFVLAGKPALVVLEYPLQDAPQGDGGTTGATADDPAAPAAARKAELQAAQAAVSAYWSEIKTASWSDIPAGHKKVSETLVERDVPRVFDGMTEMTASEEIGGKEALRGTYKHRNDWRFVEAWLVSKDCGGRLKEALGADWN